MIISIHVFHGTKYTWLLTVFVMLVCKWTVFVKPLSNDSTIYKGFFHHHKNTQTNTLHFKNKLLSSSPEE
jgi:hypothetical protein